MERVPEILIESLITEVYWNVDIKSISITVLFPISSSLYEHFSRAKRKKETGVHNRL